MPIDNLVTAHLEWIRGKARQYYPNPVDAEDLAGETIYKCLSQGKRFDASRSFKPWAQTIMENLFITQYNRRKCVLFTHLDESAPRPCSEQADQMAELDGLLGIIRECGRKSVNMESLMLYAQGYGYKEIGRKLGIPKGTAASRVCIGKKMLRKAIV